MSWVNMLSPWQWAVMALVPPLIVMLYFLKLRRVPLEVPSTYLWQRTIEDLHVNSIWQRLRKNLLLLLQLLVVLMLILACLRPGIRGTETLGKRSILMIDHSSSMRSDDVAPSRLMEAKQRARDLVDGLGSTDVAMVIAFSDRADVRQGYTSDKRRLREAIDSIEATSRTTDVSEALRAASGLANPGRTSQIEDLNDIQVAEAVPATVYILSDGGFSAPQMDLGNLSAEYIAIGEEAPDNVGILAFTVERNAEQGGQIEAFGRLHNFGNDAVELTASLSLDGELVDASQVSIDPLSSTGISFQIANVDEGELRLELEIDDDFELDNMAFAGLDPPRQLDVVLVSRGNAALESALATAQAQALAALRVIDPDSLESDEVQQLAASGRVDLFIYEQCAPQTMPAANTLFIDALPPGNAWRAEPASGPLFVIVTNRSHPMLQYADMGTVRIVEGNALHMPPGGTELLRTDAGILMAVAPREAYQDAVLGMALIDHTEQGVVPNTDWPIKRSFPVFVLNALEYLGGAVATAGSRSVKPGQPVPLSIANRFEQIEIEDPTGKTTRLDRRTQPQVIYTQTEQPGFYRVKPLGADRVLQLFTVNLFSEQESNIVPQPKVLIGAAEISAMDEQRELVRVEYWRWLLAIALGILSLEWFLYNRRVAV